jgi:hypothetical protein
MAHADILFEELIFFAFPLALAAQDKEALRNVCLDFGFKLSDGQLNQVFASVEQIEKDALSIFNDIEKSGSPQTIDVLSLITAVFQGIKGIVESNIFQAVIDGDDDLLAEVFDYLLYQYLATRQSLAKSLLTALGVITYEVVKTGDPGGRQVDFTRIKMQWARLKEFLQNNDAWKTDVYGWAGNPDAGDEKQFDIVKAVRNAASVIHALGLSMAYTREVSDPGEIEFFLKNAGEEQVFEAFLPFFQEEAASFNEEINRPVFEHEAGLKLAPLGDLLIPEKLGLALAPYVKGNIPSQEQLSEKLTLSLSVGGQAAGGRYLAITPDGVDVVGGAAVDAGFDFSITYQNSDQTPLLLAGDTQSTHLQAGAVFGSAGGNLRANFFLRGGFKQIKMGLDFQDEGFLNTLLPRPIQVNAGDVILHWQSGAGVSFEGGTTLGVSLPLHQDIGPVSVRQVNLLLDFQADVTVLATVSLATQLGPLLATPENPGARLTVTRVESGTGLLGLYDLSFGFKPPAGLGLSIDSSGFTGGGFLRYVASDGRYEGALELEFQDRITLKAIGLLATRLPGGQPGFSLLIIITSEFTPIQLGLGFTLNGVGGLLGLNRTADAERLRAGLRDNTLNSVLFPQDVVENAGRLLSDLNQLFPAQPGRFIFGPMARIGWGTPTLITIDLGLLIEIPDPVRVLILGVIRALLPDEKVRLLQLQVNFLGVIDFAAGRFALDASLYNSKLLTYTLTGDLAVRLVWGGEPDFLLTAGGFHPAYQPPPLNLPALRRLSLQLIAGDNPRLTLETYFAITANTVQFGAKIELLAKAGRFNVYGFLSFDVLFQFNPFYFIAEISAKLALRAGSSEIASISLDFTLEGPTPWRARGTAKLKICWFLTVKVRFDKTFGEARDTRLDDVRVLPLLQQALSEPGNWEAQAPGSRRLLVSLKTVRPGPGQVVAYPFGVLTIRQRVVPLAVRLQRFGSQRPADGDFFAVESVRAGQGSAAETLATEPVQEQFAPAQFFDMSDAQKLASRSFERQAGGVRLSDTARLASDCAIRRVVEYDRHVIYPPGEQPKQRRFVLPDFLSFAQWAVQGAIASSPLSQARSGRSALAPGPVRLEQEHYAVVKAGDLRPVEEGAVAGSEAGARDLLEGILRAEPALAGELLVVPAFEVNRS